MAQRSLQDKVEIFLSQAEIIFFFGNEKEMGMAINFPKEKFEIFRRIRNYENLNSYFENKKIKLLVTEQTDYYRASLVDIETGNTINLENVKFETTSFEKFVTAIPTDKAFPMFIYGFSLDGSTRIMQPVLKNAKPVMIQGHSAWNKILTIVAPFMAKESVVLEHL